MMYDFTEEEPQIRKESIQTEISKYIDLENDHEQEIQNEPLPQLKNLMSYQSDIYCEGIPRVFSSCQFQIQQPDIPITQAQPQEKTKFKSEYSEKTECGEQMLLNSELRVKRKRNAICYNNDSDDNPQSNVEMNEPCKCSKSNCLKLYCSCFHRNIECTELCKCYECRNTHDHSQIRNKALEKIKIKQQRQQHDDDLFDRSSIWGCDCKKSRCKKNYCECYIRNKKCSSHCKCNGCENKKKTPKNQKKPSST